MAHSQDDAAGPRRDGRRNTSHPSTPSAAVLTPPTGLPSVEPSAAPQVPQQRAVPPAEQFADGPISPLPPPAPGLRMCTCGHPEEMHEHYRAGTDCGSCGSASCGSFHAADEPRRRNPLARLLRRR